MTEEEVIEGARGGDADALAELYRRFAPRVFGLCRHMLGSVAAAEDATGEVFFRLGQALGSYDPAQPFPRWLLSVASHHCVDLLRRRRLELRLFAPDAGPEAPEPEDPTAGPSPLGRVLLGERRDAVRGAIERLPEHYRVPLALRYYAELGYDEIAARLGLKRNHVATLIFRAKQELRRALGARDEGQPG